MTRGLAALALATLAGCGGGEEQPRNMTGQEVADQLAQVRINPGEWELTSRIISVEAPELPRELMQAMQGRQNSIRHCITPEQASDPAAFSRNVQQRNSGCQVQDFTMKGGRMEGQTVCAGGTAQEVRSRMSGVFGPDSFDYETRVAVPAPMAGGTMNLSVRMQGRRVGACPASGAAGANAPGS